MALSSYRILHVDDDPLMRDVVELALGLDANFAVMNCADGESALKLLPDWEPDLILCDVVMPDMDGPALLKRLRENPANAEIPVFFITARGKKSERERLLGLGAAAVIAKPFVPVKLADTVRRHLRSVKLAAAGYDFAQRLRNDAAVLAGFRNKLRGGPEAAEELQSFAHRLAGAAGIFDYRTVSTSASALEDVLIERREGRAEADAVHANLEALLACIARA
jgi:CheY-like chemotaxis protein